MPSRLLRRGAAIAALVSVVFATPAAAWVYSYQGKDETGSHIWVSEVGVSAYDPAAVQVSVMNQLPAPETRPDGRVVRTVEIATDVNCTTRQIRQTMRVDHVGPGFDAVPTFDHTLSGWESPRAGTVGAMAVEAACSTPLGQLPRARAPAPS